ncbi:hypothetical protein ZIOFF_028209 [Zingiber officinale]|uniref:Vacuolar iron transporter n=1 Tax=Zingiber officinale TaxID=94328 RepID=A0A8J5GMJ1_ZINOF|nr:hypothetical protein ZIOFF_028209 [Zingiber officinale]
MDKHLNADVVAHVAAKVERDKPRANVEKDKTQGADVASIRRPKVDQVHASSSPDYPKQLDDSVHVISIQPEQQSHEPVPPPEPTVDYLARAQWLRAAVLGANDGLVSVASLMVGVGAVNSTAKAMLVSGLAGLVAGACSMAIGEFVSVYAQYDIEVAELERLGRGLGKGIVAKEEDVNKKTSRLPNPWLAAGASALAFSMGALLPLLGGGFIKAWGVRVAAVCAVSSLALPGFGAAGAVLGGANVRRSAVRVLIGGWLAMLLTYAVLRLFALVFDMNLLPTG